MIVKIVLFVIISSASLLYAMEQDLVPKITLYNWASADYVKLQSPETIAYYPIHDSTTLLELKKFIFKIDQIPIDEQKLFVFDSSGFTVLVNEKDSDGIPIENVKELISIYNTDNFHIYSEIKSCDYLYL